MTGTLACGTDSGGEVSQRFRMGMDGLPIATLRRLATASRHQYGVTLTQTSTGVVEK